MKSEKMKKYSYRDGRFWQDDRPFFLIASDYQFYRDRRSNWEDRLRKLIAAGVNCITFYIPWRHHLCQENGSTTYDFTGRTKDSRDVVGFMQLVESLGLLMIAKPGPFVHSELNVGGLPDLVSPSFNSEMPPVRRHHGEPVIWCYDATQLPAPFHPEFDALVKDWLQRVHEILVPHVNPQGALIAIQLNDETVYCTSNDPPWSNGYEPSGMRFFHKLLAERYQNIQQYNELHGTDYTSFQFVAGPKPLAAPPTQEKQVNASRSLLSFVDWAEYQWRYRRDTYVRYEEYLDIDLPYLTNYAGITPPISENIPDLQEQADEQIPPDYTQLYPEWWFAMNRIEDDLDRYEYGMISWLGVAAYDQDVFDRLYQYGSTSTWHQHGRELGIRHVVRRQVAVPDHSLLPDACLRGRWRHRI
jgi:beta-galactosidase